MILKGEGGKRLLYKYTAMLLLLHGCHRSNIAPKGVEHARGCGALRYSRCLQGGFESGQSDAGASAEAEQ
jgi:hypothetical protein